MTANTKAVIIICTRRDSKRLPNKVFRKIAGVPVIEHILRRVANSGLMTVLAVPYGNGKFYSEYAERFSAGIYEGNAESPLHRMADCLNDLSKWKDISPKYVVRITHDDILIDITTMLDLVEKCVSQNVGYGFSPHVLEGAGVEVIHVANVIGAAYRISTPVEDISYYVKGEGCPVPSILEVEPRGQIQRPNYRLTLDFPEDEVVLESILRRCGAFSSNDVICSEIDINPHLIKYNELPKVSIYTCAFNAEKFIGKTIDSVVPALQDGIEYIVIDDASTDGTMDEILRRSKNRNIKIFFNEKNEGLAFSSNRALKQCRGKYVIRLDADDKLFPDAIETMLHLMEQNRWHVLYPAYKEIDENDKAIDSGVIHGRQNHHIGGTMILKKLINEIRFMDGLRHWDGLDLFKRFEKRKIPLAYIDEPMFWYRKRAGSMSRTDLEKREKLKMEIIKNHETEEKQSE